LKNAARRIRGKISNLVKDVHWKLIQFLWQNYEIILIPIFETQQVVAKKARKIRIKTARQMTTGVIILLDKDSWTKSNWNIHG